jgi:hypothetical protein
MSPVKTGGKNKEPDSAGVPNSVSQGIPRKASTSCAPGTGGVTGRQKRGAAGDLGASNSPLITSNDAANQGKKGSKQPPKPFLRDTGEWNMFSQQKGD